VKDRTAVEAEAAIVGAVDLGAGQVARQQIRGELDPVEIGLDPGGEGLDGTGLGESWGTFHQQMAVGEQRDQQPLDQDLLADDVLADAPAQRLKLGLDQVLGGIVAQRRSLDVLHDRLINGRLPARLQRIVSCSNGACTA
jgi:hypothetical protein